MSLGCRPCRTLPRCRAPPSSQNCRGLQRRYRAMDILVQSDSQFDAPAAGAADAIGRHPHCAQRRAGERTRTFRAASRRAERSGFSLLHCLGSSGSADSCSRSARISATSLSLGETLSVLSVRLRKMIPYDSMAVISVKERQLVPELVSGDNFRLLSSLTIGLGEGLCGWVAEKRKPILNGNPKPKPDMWAIPRDSPPCARRSRCHSKGLKWRGRGAGHVPLPIATPFRPIISAFCSRSARRSRSRWKMPSISAGRGLGGPPTNLTGLPNARSLFRPSFARTGALPARTGTSLAVMVCDLDNFKQINDLYGHPRRRQPAEGFRRATAEVNRGYDYVARMGGDEFVNRRSRTQPEAASEKASRLHLLAIEAGPEDRWTRSGGMSVAPPFARRMVLRSSPCCRGGSRMYS